MHRFVFMFLLMFAAPAFASDWPQWRGPNRDGVAPDSPPLNRLTTDTGLAPAWVSEAIPSSGNGGWGSPVVADGKVYLFVHSKVRKAGENLGRPKFPWLPPEKRGHLTPAEYDDYEKNRRDEDQARAKIEQFFETLYCLSLDTGKTLWKKQVSSVYSRFVQSGTPVVVDDRVYVLGAGRMARCFDAKTGEELWSKRLPGDYRDEFMMSSFAVADGVAAVLAGSLFALDAKTGDIRWEGDKKQTSGTHSSPAVWTHEGFTFFIANVAGATACFEARSGVEMWRVKSQASQSTPIVSGNLLLTYGSSRRGGLRCYKLIPGEAAEELWTYTGASDPGSSPVIVAGHVYVQGERTLACVDLKTGDEKWQTELKHDDPRYTSLIAADGKVLYACEGLLWFAAEPAKFTPLLDLKMDDTGVIATADVHRKRLNLDELKAQPDGEKKAEQLYRSKVERQGPLKCSSPAIVDGRLIVRLKDGLVCYELTDRKQASR
ncbi:MAG: PQQ-binding-like beta-propeller repeat protein [Phycisphaeraceae bacterium]